MNELFNGIDQLPRSWSVYMILNRHTGRIYVGQARNARMRCAGHLSQLRAGNHPNYKMRSDASAHGADKFVFVALASDSEPAMIEALGAADVDRGYNRNDHLGWTLETSLREHEARLVKKRRYMMLPGVTRSTPVLRTMVMAWSRGMVGMSEGLRHQVPGEETEGS